MFARMTIVQVKLDKIDDVIKLFDSSVVPAAKKQKGYKGASLLVDRETGKGAAITYWESEKDAIANEKSLYYQEQVIKFMSFYEVNPIREGYEVVSQD